MHRIAPKIGSLKQTDNVLVLVSEFTCLVHLYDYLYMIATSLSNYFTEAATICQTSPEAILSHLHGVYIQTTPTIPLPVALAELQQLSGI